MVRLAANRLVEAASLGPIELLIIARIAVRTSLAYRWLRRSGRVFFINSRSPAKCLNTTVSYLSAYVGRTGTTTADQNIHPSILLKGLY